ncbi:MAG: hypothetical protein Q8P12_05700 [bacterium]|nr:hypothetical protein [bacterium]
MDTKAFSLTAGSIFLIVGVVHLLRIVFQWEAAIGGWQVPMWASWLAVAIAGFLAYQGLLRMRTNH